MTALKVAIVVAGLLAYLCGYLPLAAGRVRSERGIWLRALLAIVGIAAVGAAAFIPGGV